MLPEEKAYPTHLWCEGQIDAPCENLHAELVALCSEQSDME